MIVKRLALLLLVTAFYMHVCSVYVFASSATASPVSASDESNGNGGFFDWFPTLSDFTDWIVHLVVPSEEFFQAEYEKLNGKLEEKLPFQTYINTIGRIKDISGALDGDTSILDISYDFYGQKYSIALGKIIAPYLQPFRVIVTGLYVLFIALYNYRQIMHLVRGTNYANMLAGQKSDIDTMDMAADIIDLANRTY